MYLNTFMPCFRSIQNVLQTAGESSLMEDSIGGARGPSFRTMTKQDYLLLYGNQSKYFYVWLCWSKTSDGIHTLLKERKIGKEQENELYELIG